MTTIINGSSPSITFSDNSTQTTAFTTTPTINTITSAASTALTLQSAGTTAVTVNTSQNIGVGTTSPTARLHVYGGSNNQLLVESSGAEANISMTGTSYGQINNNTGDFYITNGASANMIFRTASTERMRITSNGQFTQIGNLNGDVIGNIINSNSSSPYGLSIYFNSAAPNNSSSFLIYSGDNTAARFVAMSNGGIKNYSANNVNLSDESVKKDITLAGNYLDKICAIPIKTFLYKDQSDTDLNLGVIAQDVQAVAPELTTQADWGTKENPEIKLSVYESDLMFALMKSIQELNAKVEAQATTIAELQAKVG